MRPVPIYRYLSVCSGIEAFSVAVHEIPQWSPAAFSEIDAFPCAVLAHHYPDVPNLGDMTAIDTKALGRIDWLVGGTPCQAFSNAGLRRSLADARGQLTLAFVRLAHELQEGNELRGLLWENVPSVLGTPDNAFGCFLGGLVGSSAPLETPDGARWPDAGMVAGPRSRLAWRVLNSQHFGVAQRRQRVFLVADFGNGPDPAAVLFEPRSQAGRAAQGRETRQETAGEITPSLRGRGPGGNRTGDSRGQDPLVVGTLNARRHAGGGLGTDMDLDGGIVAYDVTGTGEGTKAGAKAAEVHTPLRARQPGKSEGSTTTVIVTHTLKTEGADASEDGTGRGVPMVVVPPLPAGGNETGGHRPPGSSADTAESLIVSEYVGNAEGGLAEVASLNASNGKKTVNNQTPLVAVFDPNQVTSKANRLSPKPELSHTLPGTEKAPVLFPAGDQGEVVGFDWYASESQTLPVLDEAVPPIKTTMQPAIAYSIRPSNSNKDYRADAKEVAQTVTGAAGNPPSARGGDVVAKGQQVRRLTPRECERLQGFPNDYTLIPGLKGWRTVGDDESLDELREAGFQIRMSKSGTARVNDPDGPRYKSLGNAFTTEPVNWIMTRVTASLQGLPMPDWQPMRLWARGPGKALKKSSV